MVHKMVKANAGIFLESRRSHGRRRRRRKKKSRTENVLMRCAAMRKRISHLKCAARLQNEAVDYHFVRLHSDSLFSFSIWLLVCCCCLGELSLSFWSEYSKYASRRKKRVNNFILAPHTPHAHRTHRLAFE